MLALTEDEHIELALVFDGDLHNFVPIWTVCEYSGGYEGKLTLTLRCKSGWIYQSATQKTGLLRSFRTSKAAWEGFYPQPHTWLFI